MADYKKYSDDQLIREIDNLIDELDQRNIQDKFIQETSSQVFFVDASKMYFPMYVIAKATQELEEKHGEDYEDENKDLLLSKLDKHFIYEKFIEVMEDQSDVIDEE